MWQMRCVKALANKNPIWTRSAGPAGSARGGGRELEKENPVSEGGYNSNVAHIHDGLLFFYEDGIRPSGTRGPSE